MIFLLVLLPIFHHLVKQLRKQLLNLLQLGIFESVRCHKLYKLPYDAAAFLLHYKFLVVIEPLYSKYQILISEFFHLLFTYPFSVLANSIQIIINLSDFHSENHLSNIPTSRQQSAISRHHFSNSSRLSSVNSSMSLSNSPLMKSANLNSLCIHSYDKCSCSSR